MPRYTVPMIRIPVCAVLYFLVWYILGAAPVASTIPGWQTIVAIHAIAGPIVLFTPGPKSRRFVSYPAVFIRSLFTLVLAYPCSAEPAVPALLLTLLALESVALLGDDWPAAYIFLAFVLAFMQILPRRMYGAPMPPAPAALPLALTAWAAVVPIGIRKLLLRERELAEREREIRRQRELIDQVYLLNARFQEYALNAERKSAEEERKRITRDIHDIMGYTLVNLRVMLEVSLDLAGTENERLSAHLSEAIRHTQDGLQSARKALRNLRAMEETGELWMNRVNRILTTFSGMTGITIRVSWGNATYANCPRIKGAVYQFVQESLTNSYKHGKATEIDVDFSVSGVAPDDRFLARVVDNGSGSKHVVPGIGFDGIRERVEQLDGSSGYRNLESGFETWISIPMLSMRKDI